MSSLHAKLGHYAELSSVGDSKLSFQLQDNEAGVSHRGSHYPIRYILHCRDR